MTAVTLARIAIAAVVVLAAAFARPASAVVDPSDAPDPAYARPALAAAAASSYAEASSRWTSAESINTWIAAHFSYDGARALALSETARLAGTAAAVLTPEAFFATPRGVCVDLARFAVSTLRLIDPSSQAAYLMIEFAPVQVSGQVLRRHWMASFQRDGRHYFFADSKRPGHLAGPYGSVDEFIAEYGAYRGRPIVGHAIRQGYERLVRTKAAKTPRDVRD